MADKVILIVDDEASVQMLFRAVLERNGYRILQRNSVAEAKQLVKEYTGPIDLLVTNHHLHDGKGRDVAEQMLGSYPEMKVLHVSGHPIEELEADRSITPGAGFLQKPFSPSEIRKRVAELIGQSEPG